MVPPVNAQDHWAHHIFFPSGINFSLSGGPNHLKKLNSLVSEKQIRHLTKGMLDHLLLNKIRFWGF